ncbi:MAG: hypothetical protein ACREAW_03245 [Nitrososphaera sp.]
MEGLIELIGAIAGLLALSTGSTVVYVHWRVKRLEECIDRAHTRIDGHLERTSSE